MSSVHGHHISKFESHPSNMTGNIVDRRYEMSFFSHMLSPAVTLKIELRPPKVDMSEILSMVTIYV